MPSPEEQSTLQPVDADAIRLARTLIRSARFGALATLDPATGHPMATRVGTATDADGTPLILISALAAHRRALDKDARCGLLLGEPGKGDPLAHPRISLACEARRIERESEEFARIRNRYLNRQPKAKLYADFPDFAFFRLAPVSASLNGGFGRAYDMTPADILVNEAPALELAAAEPSAVQHMNSDHADAIADYARHFLGLEGGTWRMTGLDIDGIDLADGDRIARLFFNMPLQGAKDMRQVLVEMAIEARASKST
jgi:putative heme iron utilization protein